MKTQRIPLSKRGFTLMELMVAMAITTIIVTVLVSITSIAIDTWNRSRSELRASRQAKAMVDTMARDLEALVTRRGNANEWLSAMSPTDTIGEKLESSNSADLIFFSGSTERYGGEIGTKTDLGGDVSCIGYRLVYNNPIKKDEKPRTFILRRFLVDPRPTFDNLLGKEDLKAAFDAGSYSNRLDDVENFVCENIYQYSITFHVEVTRAGSGASSVPTVVTVPVTIGKSGSGQVAKSFKIKGTGLETVGYSGSVTADELKSGRIKAMQISLTVISDVGIDQLNSNRPFNDSQREVFIAKNSYQYSKLIQIPSM
jgi:prepilin-type N-terminal cleavage/methylation domain-containing protein